MKLSGVSTQSNHKKKGTCSVKLYQETTHQKIKPENLDGRNTKSPAENFTKTPTRREYKAAATRHAVAERT